jgi:hypothetical protein
LHVAQVSIGTIADVSKAGTAMWWLRLGTAVELMNPSGLGAGAREGPDGLFANPGLRPGFAAFPRDQKRLREGGDSNGISV